MPDPATIPAEDLKITSWPDRKTGGQHVGAPNGVRVEHIPTGLVAIVDCDSSQHRNRSIAMDMILGGLTSPHYR